jgi:L-ascorbate metabolism protein UlaG (beta-lactamase superfamily)
MKRATSDHFNGKRFFYPGEPAARGFLDVLRWKFTSRAARWPKTLPAPSPVLPVPPVRSELAITWIGHSTFLIQSRAGNWLTDPFFSLRAGPHAKIGAPRAIPAAFQVGDLPSLTGVILSHDHYDHCDQIALKAIARISPTALYTPLGYESLSAGFVLHELDWWEVRKATPSSSVQLVPARHWCRRSLGGTNVRLWGGFILRLPEGTVYFAGDTAFDERLFSAIRARCGPIDLALLPIGAYEPRWFMSDSHMNPAEAVQAHKLLGSKLSIGMHWGTIQLTDEAYDAPPRALAEARAQAGVSALAFRVMAIGERVEIRPTMNAQK